MGGQNPHKLQKVEISEDLGIQENQSKTTSEELLKIRGKKSIFYLWPSDKVSQETVLHTSRISKLFFFFPCFVHKFLTEYLLIWATNTPLIL